MARADPYEQLGVTKGASQRDIQKAYRKLAKKLHPDLNPGDKDAQRKFQDLTSAYDILGNEEKRGRFDRGEIDATGAEKQNRRYYRDFADAGTTANGYTSASGFDDFDDADDILSAFFSRAGRRGFQMPGVDRHYRLEIDFLDAVNGATKRIVMPDGSPLDVVIPPGSDEGQILSLKGKGEAGAYGAAAGDALIEIAVRPHPFFRRDGNDIRLELPISLTEAVLGGKIAAPTPTGSVTVTIPKGSNTGKTLRLKGKGVPGPGGRRGDEYLTLKIVLPAGQDPELEAFASSWVAGKSHNPRREMGI